LVPGGCCLPERRRAYDFDHMAMELLAANDPRERQSLRAKETLFFAGQRVHRMFFVEKGTVALVRSPSVKGAETVIHTARAGEWIAESSLFSDAYHCDAVARVDSEVVSARKDPILKRLRADPTRCLELADMLAAELRAARAMHEVLRTRGTEERLVRWFFIHASGSPPSVELKGTWSELADTLALSREALYRAVAKLRKSRVLSIAGDRILFTGRSRQKPERAG
jgi:CRP/FNR family transcriptional regulator, dissimilatory nitrate respiration regulator